MKELVEQRRTMGYKGIERVGVVPYRGAFLGHLLRLQLLTAFCALFGLPRWTTYARKPSMCMLDNLGFEVNCAQTAGVIQ